MCVDNANSAGSKKIVSAHGAAPRTNRYEVRPRPRSHIPWGALRRKPGQASLPWHAAKPVKAAQAV